MAWLLIRLRCHLLHLKFPYLVLVQPVLGDLPSLNQAIILFVIFEVLLSLLFDDSRGFISFVTGSGRWGVFEKSSITAMGIILIPFRFLVIENLTVSIGGVWAICVWLLIIEWVVSWAVDGVLEVLAQPIRASVPIDLFTAHLLFTYEPSIIVQFTYDSFEIFFIVDDDRGVRDHGDIIDGPPWNDPVLLGYLVESIPHEKGVEVANNHVSQHECTT